MVDVEKLKQHMEHEAKAQLAVEKLEQHLHQSSSEKLQESANLRQEAGMSHDPDERQELLDKADVANKESIAHKEKANDIAKEPESYKESFLEDIKKEAEQGKHNENDKSAAKQAQTTDITQDQDQSKEDEDISQSNDKEQEDPTAGDQIKEAFPDDGLFDKIFAEMVGNIADRIQENVSNQTKEQENAPER